MSVRFIPPCTPLLYSKTGVYSGIHYFLIFAPKHRLWVLVPTIYILSKNMKIFKKITENCHFSIREKLLYNAWLCFRNERASSFCIQYSDQPTFLVGTTRTGFLAWWVVYERLDRYTCIECLYPCMFLVERPIIFI